MIAELGNDLKTVVLAGIGAAALAGEKAGDVTEKLARKGEEVVQKGKMANEELKHHSCGSTLDGVVEQAAKLSAEDRRELMRRLREMDGEDSGES